jgi:hypothetical protein
MGLQVVQDDFTAFVAAPRALERPNFILTNPPYIRHHHLGQEQKVRLQALTAEKTGVNASGLAGFYVYYFLLATSWMADDGVAAWLIPSEFMTVNYGSALRHFLCERVTILRIHRFNPQEGQFDDALVSSAVVVFKKTPPVQGATAEFSYGGSLSSPRLVQHVPVSELVYSHKWTRYPSDADRPMVVHANGHTATRLGELFKISRGIATGANEFFIMPRADALAKELPEKYLRPILPSPRTLRTVVIDADSRGLPRVDPQLMLLDCDLPPDQLAQDYPALWAYLQTADEVGVRQRYLVKKRAPWYKQEQRRPAPFLCTYMGRGEDDRKPFRFLWNRSQAIATNLYLMLYPLERMAEILQREPDAERITFDFLASLTGDDLRGEGRVYGGGLHKMEPSELANMPADRLLARLERLSSLAPKQQVLDFTALIPASSAVLDDALPEFT